MGGSGRRCCIWHMIPWAISVSINHMKASGTHISGQEWGKISKMGTYQAAATACKTKASQQSQLVPCTPYLSQMITALPSLLFHHTQLHCTTACRWRAWLHSDNNRQTRIGSKNHPHEHYLNSWSRAKLFVSKFWDHLMILTGVKHKMSSSYHPQSNRASERKNKTVNQYICFHVQRNKTGWVWALPVICFQIMNTVNKSTGYTPFQLHFGCSPPILPPIFNQPAKDSVEYISAHEIIEEITRDVSNAKLIWC